MTMYKNMSFMEHLEELRWIFLRILIVNSILMVLAFIYSNNLLEKSTGYRVINGQKIVSGGLLAEENDVIVDNFNNPKNIFGLSDGKGDIKDSISRKDNQRIKKIKLFFKI